MIHYISNPLLGTYNRSIFEKMISTLPGDFDAVYVHTSTIGQLEKINFSSNVVIIAVDDNLEFVPPYDHWKQFPKPKDFAYFDKFCSDNPEKLLVLVIPGDHWEPRHFKHQQNIRVVNWYPFNENDTYPAIVPVEKNLDSTKIGISLSRQMRRHRYALISYLLGKNYDEFCHISAMHLYKQLEKNHSNNIMDHLDWEFDPCHDEFKNTIIKGFQKIHTMYHCGHFQKPKIEAYPLESNESTVINFDNKTNFETQLRPLYQNSFVEFVGCRLYSEPTISVDEKYVNTIYGRNFPVLLGSRHTVKLLRESGLDLFDDIVDHSYDNIENPIDRMVSAVDSNIKLILQPESTRKLWVDNRDRFNKNIDFARKKLYDYFENISLQRWKDIMSDVIIK
jgi:hypothetical protein